MRKNIEMSDNKRKTIDGGLMKVVMLVILLSLVSCATGYHKVSASGGYEEQQVGENIYEVSFYGNGYTSRSTVQKYLQRRCAELAKEKGFTHFVIASDKEHGYDKANNSAVIKLINNPSPNMIAYDAEMVMKNTAEE